MGRGGGRRGRRGGGGGGAWVAVLILLVIVGFLVWYFMLREDSGTDAESVLLPLVFGLRALPGTLLTKRT